MKAALLRNVEDLVVTDVPVPVPGPRELMIDVKACAVCGTDVKVFHHGHKHIVFPRITGHEVAGVVAETGADVAEWKKGDRVAVAPAVPCGRCWYCRRGAQSMCENLKAIGYHYDGGFAARMLVPEAAVDNGCVNRIPDGVAFDAAALAEPLACVINGQELSGVRVGDTVVVIGSGPIGCLHAEFARASGAAKVVLADISAERVAMAKFTGAVLVDMKKDDLKAAVRAMTDGRMAERVIVAAGAPQAQELSLELVARRGSVNFFGGLPKEQPTISFNSNLVHYGEFSVVGTHGSAPRHNRIALDFIAAGRIKTASYITNTFPLDAMREALAAAEARTGLKIVVTP